MQSDDTYLAMPIVFKCAYSACELGMHVGIQGFNVGVSGSAHGHLRYAGVYRRIGLAGWSIVGTDSWHVISPLSNQIDKSGCDLSSDGRVPRLFLGTLSGLGSFFRYCIP